MHQLNSMGVLDTYTYYCKLHSSFQPTLFTLIIVSTYIHEFHYNIYISQTLFFLFIIFSTNFPRRNQISQKNRPQKNQQTFQFVKKQNLNCIYKLYYLGKRHFMSKSIRKNKSTRKHIFRSKNVSRYVLRALSSENGKSQQV